MYKTMKDHNNVYARLLNYFQKEYQDTFTVYECVKKNDE